VTEEFNIGYSWALNANSVVEAEYTHVLSLHENKIINIDEKQVVNGVCCTRPLDGATGSQFASVRNEESIGRSRYDGVNFSHRQRMTHHFTLNANYTLAWAYGYDTGTTSFRNYPMLSYAPFASYEWGPSPNDERHHVTVSGLWDLPWGFQVAPILQFGSARPYAVTNSCNTPNAGGGTGTAVLVPTDAITDYLYGTSYINAYVAAGGTTSAAQQNLQLCFYIQQCTTQLGVPLKSLTIAKYDPLRGDPFFQLDLRLA
jgi:hypothetical protein